MAFNTEELAYFPLTTGQGQLSVLVGRGTSTAGSTGGEVIPGNPTIGDPKGRSVGMRSILFSAFTSESAAPDEPQAIKIYDSALDRDKLSVVTAADQVFLYFIVASNTGEDV